MSLQEGSLQMYMSQTLNSIEKATCVMILLYRRDFKLEPIDPYCKKKKVICTYANSKNDTVKSSCSTVIHLFHIKN